MQDCKPEPIPIEGQFDLEVHSTESFCSTKYRHAIGSLMYLMIWIRPNIAFSVGRLLQYMEKPTMSLWTCVKPVFRYIKGTTETGLKYNRSHGSLEEEGFWNADWAGCKQDCKSTSGYVNTISSAAVSWTSKKQSTVTTSSAEAKYVALGSLALEGQ